MDHFTDKISKPIDDGPDDIEIDARFPNRKRQIFGVWTATGLLAKIEREFAEFEQCQHFVRSGDHAFNLCLSLWHLVDWTFADMTEEERQRAEQFTNRTFTKSSEFGVAAQEIEPMIHICRVMATAGKHAEVKHHPEPTLDTMIDIYEDSSLVDGPFFFKWGVEYKEKSYDIHHVFKQAISFWRDLFVAIGWRM